MATQGLLLAVAVHPAHLQDRDGARLVRARRRHRFPRLRHLWADAGYTAPKRETWIRATTDWTLEIVRRAEPGAGFQVRPRRRRQDYEGRPDTTAAWSTPPEPVSGCAGWHEPPSF